MINVLTRLYLTCIYYVFLLVERHLAHVLDFRVKIWYLKESQVKKMKINQSQLHVQLKNWTEPRTLEAN